MVTNFEEFLELYKEEIEYIFEEAEVSKKTRKNIINLLKDELEGITAINPLEELTTIEILSLNTKLIGNKFKPMKKKKMREVIEGNIDYLSAINYSFDETDYSKEEISDLRNEGYTPKGYTPMIKKRKRENGTIH